MLDLKLIPTKIVEINSEIWTAKNMAYQKP